MDSLLMLMDAAHGAAGHGADHGAGAGHPLPPIGWVAPFVAILLAIAVLPLVHRTHHWWESNRNKLMVAMLLGSMALLHYNTRSFGVALHSDLVTGALRAIDAPLHEDHGHVITAPGFTAVLGALGNALAEYIPFITLLFSLYCISGGVAVKGSLKGKPVVNTSILAIGGLIASLVGTTGASMLLIRPLLQANAGRKKVAHSVVFFIFVVSNIGGCLLPIGDPPLFLGYLKGVPFLWTLHLWMEWALMLGALLAVYYVWDTIAYKKEMAASAADAGGAGGAGAPGEALHESVIERLDTGATGRLRMEGKINLLWMTLAVLAVALIDPSKPLPGTGWMPPHLMREGLMLALVGLSFATTPRGLRAESNFNFTAIGEVACLFIGIFVTMQIPLEILQARGGELGLSQPWHYFWATGGLSGFLDNAPTYAVFFETAATAPIPDGVHAIQMQSGQMIRDDLLTAVSLGAVFMGAMTYIGNGPNFMVKSIAEQNGVKMPSFFGFMLYSCAVLIPLFVIVTVLFM